MTAPDGFSLRVIGRERNEDMRRVLAASPVESGGLAVTFARDPDLFALPDLFSERVKCVGFFKAEEVVGFAMLMLQSRLVDGRPREVMYFGNVHAVEAGRHRGFVDRAAHELLGGPERWPELGFAVVMRGNRSAERFIGRRDAGHRDFPATRVVGTVRAKNVLVTGPRRERGTYEVRPATPSDIGPIVGLLQAELRDRLFAPVVDMGSFLTDFAGRPGCGLDDYRVAARAGRVVGVCAVWDMAGLKQTRIVRYGGKLRALRAVHAACAPLLGFPRLPREGEPLREVTITDWAVEGRDPAILEALLASVYNECRARRYTVMIVGGTAGDPALLAADGFIGPSVRSSIVMFSKDPALLVEGRVDASLPYVDLAML
jgi:hypothetical protein